MIILKNVAMHYENKPVFHSLNWQIAPGEHWVLYGASGSGKTTLLRLLCGLQPPAAGSVQGIPDGVAVVFQEDRLIAHLTVLENLRLVASPRFLPLLEQLLHEVSLGENSHDYPDMLSGGMRRRVAVLRAIVFDKELVLMDEPFTGMDERTKQAVASVIARCCKNKTLLLTSHNPADAPLLSAQVAELSKLAVVDQ